VFQGSFKGVSRTFRGYLKKVSRVFLDIFKCVLWKFKGCYKEVSRIFQRVSRVLQGKEVSRVLRGSFKDVSRKFQESFKGVSRKFKGCFKEVSRNFKGVLKKFHVVRHSSQLPEQKEGLFSGHPVKLRKIRTRLRKVGIQILVTSKALRRIN